MFDLFPTADKRLQSTPGMHVDTTPEAQAAIAACLPLRRMGAPTDIASAISWFCSDEAAWVTGQILAVDGGFLGSHGQFFRWARKAPK